MENRVKILIADGNEEFCAHVKRRLEQVSGYEIVGTAADGQRAVELMRAAKPDVLVLDLMLSKLDGITVLKRAREMDKPPAALVLTARSNRPLRRLFLMSSTNSGATSWRLLAAVHRHGTASDGEKFFVNSFLKVV